MLTCGVGSFLINVFSQFSPFSKCAEALNKNDDFIEMEEDIFPKYMSTRWLLSLLALEKMLKSWPAIKLYFLNVGQEECPVILKYIKNENGERDYNNTDSYILFPKTV